MPSTIIWRGDSAPVSQQNSLAIGAVANGNVFNVTINTKTVSYTATGTDSQTTATAALTALLSASTIPEFKEIAWTNPTSTTIVGTSATPFTQTSSSTGSTLVTSTTTAYTGPADLSNPANYSTGSLPVNGDSLYFENTANSALYNLTALSGVSLAALTVRDTFTGTIGLPKFNTNGYYEYRTQYASLGGTTLTMASTAGGSSQGAGSGRVKINGTWTTVNCNATGTPLESGFGALLMTGSVTNANVNRGFVGFAPYDGDTCTVTTLQMGFVSSKTSDANVRCGPGCTLTTVTKNYGTLETNASITTLTAGPGNHTHFAGTIGSITLNDGAVLYYRSTGTITGGTAYSGGKIDFSQDQQVRTLTAFTLFKGSGFNDPNKTTTRAPGALTLNCRVQDLSVFDLGANITI